jgi:pimeloyl-ACP methyl ester carboxylesterase
VRGSRPMEQVMRISSLALVVVVSLVPVDARASAPPPRGRLVQAGSTRLNIYCTGHGSPIVVIETGLGDFSFDWMLVQDPLSTHVRVCTYDRGGYAWSELGTEPRTFDQLNLELHLALASAGEKGPFVLVGHSYGGGPVRNYALRYRGEVAGLVLIEAVGDTQYITMGTEAQQLRTFARGRPIPEPRADGRGRQVSRAAANAASSEPLEPIYRVLPPAIRRLHEWASRQPSLQQAEDSQRDWAPEYIKRWADRPQDGVLGDLPLVVVARKDGGYPEGLNLPARTLERARVDSQRTLARWSRGGPAPGGRRTQSPPRSPCACSERDRHGARTRPASRQLGTCEPDDIDALRPSPLICSDSSTRGARSRPRWPH